MLVRSFGAIENILGVRLTVKEVLERKLTHFEKLDHIFVSEPPQVVLS